MHRILFLFVLSLPLTARAACPDLSAYSPGAQPDWTELEQQLAALLPECLESSEYFALFGAAQLNSGRLADSLESLERALLIDPNNGAASIDYAQALFEGGELFTALELNERLLEREDLLPNLEPLLASRQQSWQALTRQTSFQADVLAGYDSNLNGAPDTGSVNLTLSGESIQLALNPEFRPIRGPYLNMRLLGRYRELAPTHQHNWMVGLRGRLSEDTDSDLLQLETRYEFNRPGRQRSWLLGAGMNHLAFGGNVIFSGTDASARFLPSTETQCKPFYGLALQHQFYHEQRRLNGLESKVSAGVNCPVSSTQQLSIELGALNNVALKSDRLGGDRNGWQLNLDWQYLMPLGILRAQLSHTQLDDREGYSPLLDGGAKRKLDRTYVVLQYRQPVQLWGRNTDFLVNIYHQRRNSNIELFSSVDTTAEIGLSWAF
ncbi:MAG: tetratricopeptide repeat protein [Gammaproteobacteria bacterium]|jgi:hypothetical protein|nr:hypothetical protein [Gammaproteobacteria bacterium]MDP6094648.1 tetratricopeptide repeat protein [Gammaproteobacteria bacterium]HJO12213.1 tetratricopeptide repeat protein [Gammaproteobacteria bacterium]|tara:strand:+ start:1487 stop:2791 length:1305 start_codon:yes stop_codon:yes gene_type:complete